MKQIIIFSISILICSCSLFDYTLVSPLDEYTKDGVSVFYIHPKPISKDFYSPVTLIYKGITYEIEAKIRGGSSALYPKKSYTLKFPDDNLFSDPDNPVFTERKKIALVSNFDDNSHIRNRLAYFIWYQMDKDNNFQINTFSSEVYTNGAFEGLYTVVDFIDSFFIDRNGFDPEGNLFKGTTNEVDFRMKSDLMSGFEKKAGDPIAGEEGAYDDLESFINVINNSSDVDFAAEFTNTATVQSYYDWWFFTSFLQAWDSTGKNSYHYLDPDSEKWKYIPWDFNQSFGQSWNTKRLDNTFNPGNVNQNGIFERLIPDASFAGSYVTRYTNMLQNELHIDTILTEVDRLHNEIDKAAERDYSKWKKIFTNFRLWDDREDFTSVDEEITYIKTWLTNQHILFSNTYN